MCIKLNTIKTNNNWFRGPTPSAEFTVMFAHSVWMSLMCIGCCIIVISIALDKHSFFIIYTWSGGRKFAHSPWAFSPFFKVLPGVG